MNIFAGLLPDLIGLVGRFIPDAEKRAEAQAEITKQILANEKDILNAARDVVSAEIQSDSWMAKSWRPCLMFLLMGQIIWIVNIAPFFGLVGQTTEALKAVPPEFWTLLTIGMGGYIIGRSAEKVADSIALPNKKAG